MNTIKLPQAYDSKYYLTSCGAAQLFLQHRGLVLEPRLARLFHLAKVMPGGRSLTIGLARNLPEEPLWSMHLYADRLEQHLQPLAVQAGVSLQQVAPPVGRKGIP